MTDILLPRDARPRLADLRGLVVPGLFLVPWLALVDTGLVEHPLLVPLTKVLAATFVNPDGQQIWAALAISLVRGAVGLIVGTTLGIALGIALGLSRAATATVLPTIHTLRQITLFAWIPLLTAWFGTIGAECPHKLSGGMVQRAAIASALVSDPEILLMDELFGALDSLTRSYLQEELLRIWAARKVTVIVVTHDVEEVLFLGDTVVVLEPRPGRIQNLIQVDLPRPRDGTSPTFSAMKTEVLGSLRR